jgi:hypothetical protein
MSSIQSFRAKLSSLASLSMRAEERRSTEHGARQHGSTAARPKIDRRSGGPVTQESSALDLARSWSWNAVAMVGEMYGKRSIEVALICMSHPPFAFLLIGITSQ